MIHPCYFRKIESQHRSPFVNNLPVRTAVTPTKRARIARGQQIPQQVPHQGAQYPVHFTATERQIWDQLPPLVPINRSQNCCAKRDLVTTCASYTSSSSSDSRADSGIWTDPERSPDRPEDKHILSGKYRQYLRAHRLHPYVTSAIPLASTFPQMQQVCYNVWWLWYFLDTSVVSLTLLVIIVCNSYWRLGASAPNVGRGSDFGKSAVSVFQVRKIQYIMLFGLTGSVVNSCFGLTYVSPGLSVYRLCFSEWRVLRLSESVNKR